MITDTKGSTGEHPVPVPLPSPITQDLLWNINTFMFDRKS
jgi:hypothetical protein